MSKYVKLNDLTGFDDEFKNALGELEQRIFESYNKFMPVKKVVYRQPLKVSIRCLQSSKRTLDMTQVVVNI